MENQNGGDLTPENEVIEDVVVDESDNVDVLKEKFEKVSEQNKQLFARTKKSEGFELKDGNWVKPPKVEKPNEKPKVETKPSKDSSKPDELDFGQLAFHNTKRGSVKIETPEDVEFLKQTIADTGKSQDDILNSKWFGSELKEKQSAKESTGAVPKSKQRSGQPIVPGLDEAMAKYKDTGELPADFETRNKLIDKITDKEKTSMFDGPSVNAVRK